MVLFVFYGLKKMQFFVKKKEEGKRCESVSMQCKEREKRGRRKNIIKNGCHSLTCVLVKWRCLLFVNPLLAFPPNLSTPPLNNRSSGTTAASSFPN